MQQLSIGKELRSICLLSNNESGRECIESQISGDMINSIPNLVTCEGQNKWNTKVIEIKNGVLKPDDNNVPTPDD